MVLPSERTYDFFLSCVSKEFHDGGVENTDFESYRTRLAEDLERAGYSVAYEERFASNGTDLLALLDDCIAKCRAVIHLAGDMTGGAPGLDSLRALWIRHPNLLSERPVLRKALGDGRGISYTQWEALLALHHGKPCFAYYPGPGVVRGPHHKIDPDQVAIQEVHRERLMKSGLLCLPCGHAKDLSREVLICLLKNGLIQTLPPGIIRHNLPFISLGTQFKGREEFLEKLHAAVQGHQAAAITQSANSGTHLAPTAIHALGGQGKTRAAIEYAWLHLNDYAALLFVSAPSPEDLDKNLAALCDPLAIDLPTKSRENEQARCQASLRWLEQNSGWLLIFDNVDSLDAAAKVRQLLPRLHRGHVVVTSRIANWDGGIKSLDLSTLAPEAGRDLILESTNEHRASLEDDETHALGISHDAGHLALALQQAASYVNRRKISLSNYRQLWRDERGKILTRQQQDKDAEKSLPDYSAELLTTWETTRLQVSEGAKALLDQLAWMAPQPIPRTFVEKLVLPDGVEAGEALVELVEWHFSELSVDGAAVQVHAMVQEITRQQLRRKGKMELSLGSVLNALVKASELDVTDVRQWPTVEPLRAHLAKGADLAESSG